MNSLKDYGNISRRVGLMTSPISIGTGLDSLTNEKGVVLFEDRVWIPEALKVIALQSLHVGHVGMVKMKAISRKCIFWPNLTNNIEAYATSCETCKFTSSRAQQDEFCPWPKANESWERIHIDFFHFGGKTL